MSMSDVLLKSLVIYFWLLGVGLGKGGQFWSFFEHKRFNERAEVSLSERNEILLYFVGIRTDPSSVGPMKGLGHFHQSFSCLLSTFF